MFIVNKIFQNRNFLFVRGRLSGDLVRLVARPFYYDAVTETVSFLYCIEIALSMQLQIKSISMQLALRNILCVCLGKSLS